MDVEDDEDDTLTGAQRYFALFGGILTSTSSIESINVAVQDLVQDWIDADVPDTEASDDSSDSSSSESVASHDVASNDQGEYCYSRFVSFRRFRSIQD